VTHARRRLLAEISEEIRLTREEVRLSRESREETGELMRDLLLRNERVFNGLAA
jgi:hypothetical protein